jgi:hypothetical protein
VHSSLYAKHHTKVVKSVKMKPPEIAILRLPSIGVVLRRLRRFTLQAIQHFRGSSASSKALCRSPSKMEGCLLQLMLWHARRVIPWLGSFSLVVGRAKFHE